MKKSFVFATLAAILFTGCTGQPEITGNWTCSEIIIDGNLITGAKAEIIIEQINKYDYTFRGNSGVNSLSGTVTVNKNIFKPWDNFASTKMMGEPVAQTFEDNFLICLMKADSCKMEDENTIIIENSVTGNKLKLIKN